MFTSAQLFKDTKTEFQKKVSVNISVWTLAEIFSATYRGQKYELEAPFILISRPKDDYKPVTIVNVGESMEEMRKIITNSNKYVLVSDMTIITTITYFLRVLLCRCINMQ